MNRIFWCGLMVFLVMLCSRDVIAQSSIKTKPTAIVFMLHLSTNKIASYKRKKMMKEAREVMQTDQDINSSIIRDFKAHFNFCPVYFFYDTLLQFVKERKWDRVELYDFEHLSNLKRIEISDLSNYLIAEVNYPPMQSLPTVDEKGNLKEADYIIDYAAARDYGILLYNEEFNLLRSKLQYTNISLRRKGSLFKPGTLQYTFEGAEKFQSKLKKYYTK